MYSARLGAHNAQAGRLHSGGHEFIIHSSLHHVLGMHRLPFCVSFQLCTIMLSSLGWWPATHQKSQMANWLARLTSLLTSSRICLQGVCKSAPGSSCRSQPAGQVNTPIRYCACAGPRKAYQPADLVQGLLVGHARVSAWLVALPKQRWYIPSALIYVPAMQPASSDMHLQQSVTQSCSALQRTWEHDKAALKVVPSSFSCSQMAGTSPCPH